MRITNVKEARAAIGQRVWWDDVGKRYIFVRSGTLTGVKDKNVEIDGDWKWRPNLTNLRTTELDEWG